jgi:hypothetical protein
LENVYIPSVIGTSYVYCVYIGHQGEICCCICTFS